MSEQMHPEAETAIEREARLAQEARMIAEARADVAAGRVLTGAELDAWLAAFVRGEELWFPDEQAPKARG